ncbi:MAG: bifunctional adenosylcobinamide kinase/adenosylcobinamide-phosphate guanylyltransferase [Nitrospira sp.]|nr:bifunctional adenosylcobinamide kinase/adenosylcobinamide-phosphate guanylyltransferase [Nitrospira sp.]
MYGGSSRSLTDWFRSDGSQYRTIVVDCLTLWMSNVCGRRIAGKDLTSVVDELIQAIQRTPAQVVLVGNELGYGLADCRRVGMRAPSAILPAA